MIGTIPFEVYDLYEKFLNAADPKLKAHYLTLYNNEIKKLNKGKDTVPDLIHLGLKLHFGGFFQ
jgi:hypothetical protein